MNSHIRKGYINFTKNVKGLFSKSEHKPKQCDARTSGRVRSKFHRKGPKRPKEPGISSNEKYQESPEEKGQESFLHDSPCHSEPANFSHSPEREVADTSPELVQLKSEAQHQHPPPSPKPSRTRTFNSIRSVGASSIRSVAFGIKKLVCMPRLTCSEPHLPHHPQGRPVRAYTDLALRSREPDISEEDIDGPLLVDSEESFSRAPRHGTFPLDKTTMPSPALIELRAKLRQRQETSEDFNHIWENKALPHLREIIHTDYSISIQADYGGSHVRRVVEVMTETQLPDDRNLKLTDKVSEVFGKNPSLTVEISFTVGNIKRSTESEDNWVPPGNPSRHFPLMMGDSVDYEGGRGAATLGPAINCGDQLGCLVNYHLFDGAPQLSEVQHDTEVPDCHLVHPASIDCITGESPRIIGKLRAHSGLPMYRTHRKSRSLAEYFIKIPGNQPRVLTDWAYCDLQDEGACLQNRIRYAPTDREFQEHSGIVSGLFQTRPNLRLVRSSGRSSGIRYATVCETPAEVRQGTTITREWYLENVSSLLPNEQWNTGGIGIPGDSGAAVVDDETRELIGQVWGRNVYHGHENIRRVAYFTHFADIFDDIKERYPHMGDVKLANAQSVPNFGPRPDGRTTHPPRVTFSPTIQVGHHGFHRSSYQRPAPDERMLQTSASKTSLTSSTSSGTIYIDPSHAMIENGAMNKEMEIVQPLVPPSKASVVI